MRIESLTDCTTCHNHALGTEGHQPWCPHSRVRTVEVEVVDRRPLLGWICRRCGSSWAPTVYRCDCAPTTSPFPARKFETPEAYPRGWEVGGIGLECVDQMTICHAGLKEFEEGDEPWTMAEPDDAYRWERDRLEGELEMGVEWHRPGPWEARKDAWDRFDRLTRDSRALVNYDDISEGIREIETVLDYRLSGGDRYDPGRIKY